MVPYLGWLRFSASLIAYLFGIIIYGIIGGISSALTALIYNIVAGMVGGLQVALD